MHPCSRSPRNMNIGDAARPAAMTSCGPWACRPSGVMTRRSRLLPFPSDSHLRHGNRSANSRGVACSNGDCAGVSRSGNTPQPPLPRQLQVDRRARAPPTGTTAPPACMSQRRRTCMHTHCSQPGYSTTGPSSGSHTCVRSSMTQSGCSPRVCRRQQCGWRPQCGVASRLPPGPSVCGQAGARGS